MCAGVACAGICLLGCAAHSSPAAEPAHEQRISAYEKHLTAWEQRLDARERRLDEREQRLTDRETALAGRPRTDVSPVDAGTSPSSPGARPQADGNPVDGGASPTRGITFRLVGGAAQYGGAAWDNVVQRIRRTDVETCKQACAKNQSCTFFFFNARGNLAIGHHHQPPDPSINSGYMECVLFSGDPWWGSAPQSDGYIKLVDGVEANKVKR